jgi:DNA topoisomerase-1
MLLLLVESPSKCKKIESFLKEDYPGSRVMATCGHFREVHCIRPDFSIEFHEISSKIRQISSFLYQHQPEVILATDNDREGEAIAWHLCDYFSLPVNDTKRILFNEITKSAILEAMANPTVVDMKIVHAQMARVICDRWIGYRCTPPLWSKFAQWKNVSAGRCQTPTLRLVQDREEEIEKNTLKLHVLVECHTANGPILAINKPLLDASNEFIRNFLTESKTWDHVVLSADGKEATRNAPPPFVTSSLQQYCSSTFHWSTVQVMQMAQKLYEKGFITYHRTESTMIADSFRKQANEWIVEKYGETYLRNDVRPHKPGAHECIRPTAVVKDTEELAELERKLYDAIWKRTMQSLMSACCLDVVMVRVNCPLGNSVCYEKTIERVKFPGYRILQTVKESDESRMVAFTKGQKIMVDKIVAKEAPVKKILHYNEGQLVKLLDEKKIGRPSTFSSFVQKVQDREYVQKQNFRGPEMTLRQWTLQSGKIYSRQKKECVSEKQKLVLQKKGSDICRFLYDEFDRFFNFAYTAEMEANLDKIATGTLQKDDFLKLLETELGPSKTQAEVPSCLRVINHDLTIRPGKNGWSDYIFIKSKKNV